MKLSHASEAFFSNLLKIAPDKLEGEFCISDTPYIIAEGIIRRRGAYSKTQAQSGQTFEFLWMNTELNDNAEQFQIEFYRQHFPGIRELLDQWLKDGDLVLDAGCGAGFSAMAFFGRHLKRVKYIGVDISRAVEVARKNFSAKGYPAEFMQDDISDLSFPAGSFDFIFSAGVLHHTDSVQNALHRLSTMLRSGGRMLIWVYRKQPPLREFADQFIRTYLAPLSNQEAYDALIPLTKLGQVLGRTKVEIEIDEPIEMLGIPAGKFDLQRFFYYYVLKTFYNDKLSFERANMQNFDWYRPLNAHTSTVEELLEYSACSGLIVEHQFLSPSGISLIFRKSEK